MQQKDRDSRAVWLPLRGSWEESVLTWNEQVDLSFRRQEQERAPVAESAKKQAVTSSTLT